MPAKQTALKRCTEMDKRWNRKAVSRGSDVMVVIRLPISWMKDRPSVHIGPIIIIMPIDGLVY